MGTKAKTTDGASAGARIAHHRRDPRIGTQTPADNGPGGRAERVELRSAGGGATASALLDSPRLGRTRSGLRTA